MSYTHRQPAPLIAGFKYAEALGRIVIGGAYPCTLKCYNLHALTIVIITKYMCIYIFDGRGGPLIVEVPGQLSSLPPS